MPTITRTDGQEKGLGAASPLAALGNRRKKIGFYTVDFDSSYPTGGEDISSIWNDFREVFAIFVMPHDPTVADNRIFVPDLAAKKLKMLTAVNTEAASASNQSAVTGVRLVVCGY